MRDIAYAIRSARQSASLTLAAMVTLALAIGANTAVFTLLETLVLRGLPVDRPEQLAMVTIASAKGIDRSVTDPFYRHVVAGSRVLMDCAAADSWTTTAIAEGRPERVEAATVTANYFRMLGVRPAAGQFFAADNAPVAVLSYQYWQRRFGGDPAVIGSRIQIAANIFTVIGVSRRSFFGLRVGDAPDVYLPLEAEAQLHPGHPWRNDPQVRWLTVVGRVPTGVPLARAQSELDGALAQWLAGAGAAERDFRQYPEWLSLQPAWHGIDSSFSSDFGDALRITFALVGLVLAIGCGNIANLLLARSEQRRREMALRVALGAGPWRLARQTLVESLLLAAAGGALGVALAPLGVKALLARMPAGQRPVYLDVQVNWRVLLFAATVSIGTGILFGLMPAFRAARTGLSEALKETGATATATRTRGLTAHALIAGQVAFSLVLLVAAGLFVRTLSNIRAIDAGFPRDHLLLASMEPGALGWRGERLAGFYRDLLARVSLLPGVRSAAVARIRVLSGGAPADELEIVGYRPKPNEDMSIELNVISPGYFATLGIPLGSGRDFTPGDNSQSHGAVIINQEAARRFFPGRNPVGEHVRIIQRNDMEIVGVVSDAKYGDLRFHNFPILYIPVYQRPDNADRAAIHIRFNGGQGAATRALEGAVRALEPRLPLYMVRTMEDDMDNLLARERMMATLGVFFGCVALSIAAVGVYGVLSNLVARRTREIGIRMALGAGPKQVMRHVVGQSLAPVVAGTLAGIPLAAAGARALGSLLYGVKWNQAPVYALAAAALVAAAAVAAWIPARRATRVDPLEALRTE
jgi:predicted permease